MTLLGLTTLFLIPTIVIIYVKMFLKKLFTNGVKYFIQKSGKMHYTKIRQKFQDGVESQY